MSTNVFDERIANVQARSERERLHLDKLKLAWEIAQKERTNAPPNIDQALGTLRKIYSHINETLIGQ